MIFKISLIIVLLWVAWGAYKAFRDAWTLPDDQDKFDDWLKPQC